MDNDTGSPLIERRSPNPFLENAFETDCVLMGDYFELNNLIDPGSRSSSSANSSCLTMTSEEYFDSMALLQELDYAIADQEMKDSNVNFNLSAPIQSKQVLIHPATSGVLFFHQILDFFLEVARWRVGPVGEHVKKVGLKWVICSKVNTQDKLLLGWVGLTG